MLNQKTGLKQRRVARRSYPVDWQTNDWKQNQELIGFEKDLMTVDLKTAVRMRGYYLWLFLARVFDKNTVSTETHTQVVK